MSDLPFDVMELETQAEGLRIRAAVREIHKKEQKERSHRNLVSNWPLGLALILALLAPQIYAIATAFGPWAAGILLPCVALIECKQMHVSPDVLAHLRQVALYAQFPMGALVAKSTLKGHVTIGGVAILIVLFHSTGAMLVWFISTFGS